MKKTILVLTVSLLFLACSKKSKSNFQKHNGYVFGTTYNIIYDSNTDYSANINKLFKEFNNSLSTYDTTSVISRVNKNDTTVVLDKYFIDAYHIAKRIYIETDGYFDPTIGKLIDAYGFGSGKAKKEIPQILIDSILSFTGFEKITLENNKINKHPNIEFNVNAYAKGQGIDVIGKFLESKKITNYLVEIGGEIRAKGVSPKNKAWNIGIDNPNTDGSRSQSNFIRINNKSMATSGNYRKFKINDNGEKIVHTVNPKTGLARESNLLSVSVIIDGDCADADAYATAFLAMGLEKTKAFIKNRNDIKVVLIYTDKNGELVKFKN